MLLMSGGLGASGKAERNVCVLRGVCDTQTQDYGTPNLHRIQRASVNTRKYAPIGLVDR